MADSPSLLTPDDLIADRETAAGKEATAMHGVGP
jgi:hypothetical protein